MRIIAIIPARGGSKGIHRKNVRILAGKPLIAHTIEQARRAQNITQVVVSTDDAEIGAVAREFGAEVIHRPLEISDDTATSESALVHALDQLAELHRYEPELVVFLQCTSPIRRDGDIDNAIAALLKAEADSLLSVVRTNAFLWRFVNNQAQSLNYDYRARPRRQDREPQFIENGSIYVFKPWVLRRFANRLGGKIALYEMDERSAIDIDTEWDLELCEWVLMHSNWVSEELSVSKRQQ